MLAKAISRTVRNRMAELRPSQLDEYGLPQPFDPMGGSFHNVQVLQLLPRSRLNSGD